MRTPGQACAYAAISVGASAPRSAATNGGGGSGTGSSPWLPATPDNTNANGQPNASAHLACLGECGLVTRERRGKFVYYAIADKRVVKVLEDAEAMLAEIGARVDQCPRYVAPAGRTQHVRVFGRRGARAG